MSTLEYLVFDNILHPQNFDNVNFANIKEFGIEKTYSNNEESEIDLSTVEHLKYLHHATIEKLNENNSIKNVIFDFDDDNIEMVNTILNDYDIDTLFLNYLDSGTELYLSLEKHES